MNAARKTPRPSGRTIPRPADRTGPASSRPPSSARTKSSTSSSRSRSAAPDSRRSAAPSPTTTSAPPPADEARPRTWKDVQPWVSLLVRLALAGIVLWSGFAKASNFDDSIRAVGAYQVLPAGLVTLVGYALPVGEILLGVLLLAGLLTRLDAIAFGVLMIVFIAGIVQAWARGLSIDCGCFGGGGPVDIDETQYLTDILRDLAFLAGACYLAIWPRSRWSADRALGLQAED